MPLIRGHHSFDDHFTRIPNHWLRDSRLSLQSRGLLAQLMSHSPGWKITQESLAKANNIGRDAMRSMLKELVEYGYLLVSEKRQRNADGTLGGYIYTTGEPKSDEPTLAEPTQADPTHKKNILKEEQLEETSPAKAERATRVDTNFKPSPENSARMQAEYPTLDLKAETDKFIDFWVAQPGGRKLDWQATWRNWIRNSAKRTGHTPQKAHKF